MFNCGMIGCPGHYNSAGMCHDRFDAYREVSAKCITCNGKGFVITSYGTMNCSSCNGMGTIKTVSPR